MMEQWTKTFRYITLFILGMMLVCAPSKVQAQSEGDTLVVYAVIHKNEHDIEEVVETVRLGTLQESTEILDFSTHEVSKKYNIQGKLVYDPKTNTLELNQINNTRSDYPMYLSIAPATERDFTYRLVGENKIKGSVTLSRPSVSGSGYWDNDKSAILTGDGVLDIESTVSMHMLSGYALMLSDNFKIENTKIHLEGVTGLEHIGGIEIINSKVDILADAKYYPFDEWDHVGLRGIKGGRSLILESSDVNIRTIGGGGADGYYGSYLGINDSKLTINIEKTKSASGICFQSYTDSPVMDLVNSEVYVNVGKRPDNVEPDEKYRLIGIYSEAYYDYGQPKRQANIKNSILEVQGEDEGIRGILVFKESLHDVYVKENLANEKTPYPIKSEADKRKLATAVYGDPSPYKYVRIEPHLKSFVIDADSAGVDQSIYRFVKWESKGFRIDEPEKKRTKAFIPIVWQEGAYVRGIWEKIGQPGKIRYVPMSTGTTYVTTLEDYAYLKGYPGLLIRPEGNMTRAEAIATLVRLERIKEKDGRGLKEGTEVIYKDVFQKAWYKKYIDYAWAHQWL